MGVLETVGVKLIVQNNYYCKFKHNENLGVELGVGENVDVSVGVLVEVGDMVIVLPPIEGLGSRGYLVCWMG